MKHLIVAIIEKYRNHKSVSSEEIADQVLEYTNSFSPIDTKLILKKLDDLQPQIQMIMEEKREVDDFKKKVESVVSYIKINTKNHMKLTESFNDYKDLMVEKEKATYDAHDDEEYGWRPGNKKRLDYLEMLMRIMMGLYEDLSGKKIPCRIK